MTSGKCKKCHQYFFDAKNLIAIIENKICTGCYVKPDKYFDLKCKVPSKAGGLNLPLRGQGKECNMLLHERCDRNLYDTY
jgi:predicted CXXCH cytochrome family protein